MIPAIIILLVIFIIIIYKNFDFSKILDSIIICSVFIIFIGAGSLIIVLSISSDIMTNSFGYRATRDHIQIHSLSNGVEVKGSFFLGSGNFNGEEYYYYFINEGEGLIRGKVPVNKSVIIEGERNPEVAIEKTFLPDWVTPWWCLGVFNDNPYYRIYVPKGTVIQQYSVK